MTTTPHESALLAAAEAMRDAEIGYSINLTRLVDGVAEHTATLPDGSTHVFQTSAAASEFVERERNLAKAKAAVEAYLSSIGGIVCAREPVAIGVQRMGEIVGFIPGGDVTAEYRLPEDDLPRVPLHISLSIAGKGDDGWQSMDTAPKDGTNIQVWSEGYEWPECIRYELYDLDTAKQVGSEGYWRYSEQLLADVAEVDDQTFTHWRPIPPPPSIPSDEGSEKP